MLSPTQLADALSDVADKDRSAFERVYHAVGPRLFAIILRILRRRDLAEEVLQDVFVTIWERAGEFDASKTPASTWLSSIARARALDVARRASASAVEEADGLVDGTLRRPDPTDPSTPGRQAYDDLLTCMQQLEPNKRDLVVLAYRHGLSREALARRLGKPVSTIRGWLQSGLAEFKACLDR